MKYQAPSTRGKQHSHFTVTDRHLWGPSIGVRGLHNRTGAFTTGPGPSQQDRVKSECRMDVSYSALTSRELSFG